MSKYIKLDDIKKYPIRLSHYDHEHGNFDFVLGIESLMEYIDQLPTEEIPQQPGIDAVAHAHWKYDPNGMDWNLGAWKCSACGCRNNNIGGDEKLNPLLFAGSKYCPNCGAVMDESEEEHERSKE